MTDKPSFAPLHLHTTYSLGDATTNIPALAKRLASLGMKSCAITDHGNMAGVIEFQKECKKNGIKPIFGIEAYISLRTAKEPKSHDNPTGHIILLAKDLQGYRNLCSLLDWSNRFGFSHKPRIDTEILSQHVSGLVGLSSCIGGLPQRRLLGWSTYDHSTKGRLLQDPQPELLDKQIMDMVDVFGKGNYFLEIQNHSMPNPDSLPPGQREDYDWLMKAQNIVAKEFISASRRLGVPIVGTNDTHYLSPELAESRQIVLAIGDKQVLAEGFQGSMEDAQAIGDKTIEQSAREVTGQMYLKSPEEMYIALHGDRFPSLLSNTMAIAEMCNVSLEPPKDETGKSVFNLPKVELAEGETLASRFRAKIEEGFKIRYPGNPKEARDRLEYELSVMTKLGFESYHIIVADFVNWAKDRDIPVGDGRGSGAGSIIVYCLGITNIDPLRHHLIFERYLNPDRVTAPDLDIDFDPTRVDEVINYCKGKYGDDRVAFIAAYQSLHAKGSIKKVGKVFRLSKEWRDQLTESLPEDQGEHRVHLSNVMEDENSRTGQAFVRFFKKGGDLAKKMLDVCIKLDDTKIYRSEHAAGIVISGTPLREVVPLACYDREQPDRLTVEVPHVHLEEVGLLKMDFLVVEGLTVIQRTIDLIRQRKDPKFCLRPEWEETYADQKTFNLFRDGSTYGIWQLSSSDIRRVCIELGPTSLDDIASLIALYRPGPLDYIDPVLGINMVEIFIRRKQGILPIEYDLPCLEEILANTYGVIVYQEQLMHMSRLLCGWTMNQADKLRKAVGKKEPEAAKALEKPFVDDCIKHSKCDPDIAQKIWDKIVAFARYGFNKAHSVSYGKMAYQMASLKVHHPVEFMAACLGRVTEKGDKDIRVGLTHFYVDECNRLDIPVLPPDIAYSRVETIPEGDSIRIGFNLINGVATSSGKKIEQADIKPEDSLGQVILKLGTAGVGPAMMKNLAKAGAFSRYGTPAGVTEVITKFEKTKTSKKRMNEFFGLAPTLGATETPPLSPEDLENNFNSILSLVPARVSSPPAKRLILSTDKVDSLECFNSEGLTSTFAWVRLDSSRWGLFDLGNLKTPEKLPKTIRITDRV